MKTQPDQPASSSPSSISPQAESLYASYLGRVEAGPAETLDSLCERHPELAVQLRQLDEQYRRFRARAGEFGLGQDLGRVRDVESELAERMEMLRNRSPRRWPYRIGKTLGEGTFGVVQEALDESLGRTVALKTLKLEGTGKDRLTRMDRFLEEARILFQLNHPGIVAIHSVGLDPQDRPWFSMQLIEGRDFGEVIDLARADQEGWTVRRALESLLTICDALAYAHARGILHRDVKPSNVRVTGIGKTYLMDWGLARSRRQLEHAPEQETTQESPEATSPGTAIGTLAYMSPEQARGEQEKVGAASDVYAVGALLYRILTGVHPYAEHKELTPARVVREPPRSVHDVAPGADKELLAICKMAMQRDPSHRYASMAELSKDLRAHLENRPVRARNPGPLTVALKWTLRNRALSMSAAAVLASTSLAFLGFQEVQAREQASLRAEFFADVEELQFAPLDTYGLENSWNDDVFSSYVQEWRGSLAKVGVFMEGDLQPELDRIEPLSEAENRSLLDGFYSLADAQVGALRRKAWNENNRPYGLEELDKTPIWRNTKALLERYETREWRRRAWGLFLSGQYAGESLLELAEDPRCSGADLSWMGGLAMAIGGDVATRILERAVELDPGVFTAQLRLGLNKGSLNGLLHHSIAVALRPDLNYAWYSLGWDHHQLSGTSVGPEREHHRSEAIRCYRRAIACDDRIEPAHSNLSVLVDPEEGVAILQAFQKKYRPASPDFFINLSYLLLGQGRPKEAEEAARSGIELSPAQARLHHHLGRALQDSGRIVESMGPFEEAARLDPTLWEARTNAAGAHIQAAFDMTPGEEPGPEALEHLQRAYELATESLRMHPGELRTVMNIAAIHGWREELEQATDSLEPFAREPQARAMLAQIRDVLTQRGTDERLLERLRTLLDTQDGP